MFIYLLLTEKCNLSCVHCIRGVVPQKTMDFSEIPNIINQTRLLKGKTYYVLTGGEPTLHPDFTKIVLLMSSVDNSELIINSNGTTHFIKDNLDLYRLANVHIQFSIDGSRETHDRIRGQGVFDKALQNMDLLRTHKIDIWVSTVVTPDNINSIDDLRDLLVQYGISKWHINPILPFGCGSHQKMLSVKEWNRFVDHLIETTPLRLGIRKLFDFSSLDNLPHNQLENLVKQIQKKHLCNCGTVNNKIYVYPDLTVYGCTCLKEFPLGNLRGASLLNILSSSESQKLKNYTLEPNSPCNKCRYVDICNGGCIGMSFRFFGRLGVGDCRCPLFMELSK